MFKEETTRNTTILWVQPSNRQAWWLSKGHLTLFAASEMLPRPATGALQGLTELDEPGHDLPQVVREAYQE